MKDDEHVAKELCDEKMKHVESKLNFIGSLCKSILIMFILEVCVLGFIAIKGYVQNG